MVQTISGLLRTREFYCICYHIHWPIFKACVYDVIDYSPIDIFHLFRYFLLRSAKCLSQCEREEIGPGKL